MTPSRISLRASSMESCSTRAPLLVEHAGHVGEQQQALGLHAGGERAGERVGVDVERLALAADGDRGDDRDEVGLGDHLDDVRVDLGRVADVADVDRLHEIGLRVGHLGDLAGDHQVGVLAGDADRLAALPVDGGDDVLVDQAGQHHLDHLDGGLVGDAQAVHELALQLQALEHAGDLRAAAVHDDRVHAGLLEQHDVLREGGGEVGVAHGVAAELHHHDLLVVALHVRQGFGQDVGLLQGRYRADTGPAAAPFSDCCLAMADPALCAPDCARRHIWGHRAPRGALIAARPARLNGICSHSRGRAFPSLMKTVLTCVKPAQVPGGGRVPFPGPSARITLARGRGRTGGVRRVMGVVDAAFDCGRFQVDPDVVQPWRKPGAGAPLCA